MQLLLPVTLNPRLSFDTFVEPEKSSGLITSVLKEGIDESEFTFYLIVGSDDVGKSHILNACCHHANRKGKTSMLMPMEQVIGLPTETIDGLEKVDVLCIDDLNLVLKDHDWQIAIFNLFNSMQQNKSTLIISSNVLPAEMEITLPDLASRMQWGTLFQLTGLNNDEKVKALITHANDMSFELPEDVAKLMLNRLPRKMSFLMQALYLLSRQTIEKKRKVTVPFAKEVLEI
ncbi:DnaA regulatory inactivator Hda [Psychrosphaera sp. B3R10]|uniref:DnaA regulatory inactivator Hda n=1 Tax=unclassified Psychrosphaera TaxID=2641570 RepID=UPI001C09710A|nr:MULTISPECIES: DnaA regulatory inactivator Hda [unclassified Psychrosphaera]MBU2881367.1 DnaA regulatory inactivator Hda [Psychrosphaera sp. I2R16]MBU2988466.1 DnaA regulatory inactivator Hda [Psychrosphaera sp. B3R10]